MTKKYFFVIFLILVGLSCTAYGQYLGDKVPPKTMYDVKTGEAIFPPSYVDFYYSDPRFEKHSIVSEQYRYDIPYMISNGTIPQMEMDCSSVELVLDVKPSGKQGWITLVLPRQLIDSKTVGDKDDDFFVLLDSKEIQRSDIASEKLRLLLIPFSNDASQVSIIGVNYPEQMGENACNGTHDPPFSYLFSPLKQFKSEIAMDDIRCKKNLVLVQKYDGSPACVKHTTAAELTNKEKRSGWDVSDQLWKLLSEKMDESGPENSCPRYCLILDEKYVVDGIDKTLGNPSGLPKFLPENYDHFQFHHREVYSVVQISTNPISLDTSWDDFYWKDNGIFLRYSEVPITLDGKTQTAYWAKTHDAEKLDLPSSDGPVYLKEREISYSDEFDMLYPTLSEAQFNYGELVVVISGYVSGENMLKIVDSFFEK